MTGELSESDGILVMMHDWTFVQEWYSVYSAVETLLVPYLKWKGTDV